MFQCEACGSCCQSLKGSSIYSFLHSGDGVCRHYLQETKKCSIYKERPNICDMKYMYKNYFKEEYEELEFYELNKKVCESLRQNLKNEI